MSLLSRWTRWGRTWLGASGVPTAVRPIGPRRCRFEDIERRQMLSAAPVHVGVVYVEDDSGSDVTPDRFEISFSGGAPGTKLRRLVIDGDQDGNGFDADDVFFDTVEHPNSLGVLQAHGPTFHADLSDDVGTVTFTVADGSTRWIIEFSDFDVGERAVLSIDVDEAENFNPAETDWQVINSGFDTLTSGIEFQDSVLTATVEAPHFHPATGSDIFWNAYDGKFAGKGLELPADGDGGFVNRTAGGVVTIQQQPLPISIRGTVFKDPNLNNIRDSGEIGLAGVELTLLRQDGNTFTPTGHTATTDANGEYRFEGGWLLPGTYRIVETQPAAPYFSVGATAGRVLNDTRGLVVDMNTIGDIVLFGGENSVGNDFAEALPGSLSGYVYIDANDNGFRDAGEVGIGGVTVALLDASGNPTGRTVVTSTVAGTLGYYIFDNVLPGAYGVQETHPAAFDDGKDQVGSSGGTALAPPGDRITGAVIASEQNAVNYNFGELIPPGTLSGYVHSDPDLDCNFDSGEQPIAGVTIELLDNGGNVLRTTQTDANGRYVFMNLPPGLYGVRELQPNGYFHGGQRIGSGSGTVVGDDRLGGIQVQSRVDLINYNFCEIPPAEISGYVYVDANENGTRNAGEQGLAGVTVRLLDANGNPTGQTTTTDSQGYYQFTGLRPGTYGVAEDQPPAYDDGRDEAGDAGGTPLAPPGDRITGATLHPDQHARNYNFGELVPPGSLSGFVYSDPDGDCVFDQTETPIAGVTIELLDVSGNVLRTTQTDANGRYEFTLLPPGIYAVRERQPSGFYHGGQTVGSGSGTIVAADHIGGIGVQSRVTLTNYNFCETPPASISGHVYLDANNNGIREANEELLNGVTVRLLDASGNPTGQTAVTSTVNGRVGYYSFTGLRPGTYGVEEIHPAAYRDGKDTPGNAGGTAQAVPGDRITGAVLQPDQNATEYNFGERPLPGRIRGYVHSDPDRDCVFDQGEAALAGVTVQLIDQATGQVVRTTVTDANGLYQFNDVELGTYTIREIQPAGYYHGGQTVGTLVDGEGGGGTVSAGDPDNIRNVVVGAGGDLVNYNFCELPPGTLSGYVHSDPDQDCIFDSHEAPIAGVVIELLDTQGNVLRTATTNANGFYQFTNLAPGVYAVRERQPSGFFHGGQKVGSGPGTVNENDPDFIRNIDLAPGVDLVDYNFCELPPASLSGVVFSDPDQDCVRDPGEAPIAGVTIELYNAAGTLVRTTKTDANGVYRFENLRPGIYTVREGATPDFFDGGSVAGRVGNGITSLDDLNSISQIALAPAENLVDYNFCEIPPVSISGYVFQDGPPIATVDGKLTVSPDSIRDGLFTSDDTPLAGVRLTLGHGKGGEPILGTDALPGLYDPNVGISVVTDASGFYQFRGLRPGNYGVFQIQPTGFLDSRDTKGTTPTSLAINQSDPVPSIVLEQLTRPHNYDAILNIQLPAGTNSQHNNFSEVTVTRIPAPLPTPKPVTVPPLAPRPFTPPPFVPSLPTPFTPLVPTIRLQSGHAGGYTWHLSVINNGTPRGTPVTRATLIQSISEFHEADADIQNRDLQQAKFTLAPAAGREDEAPRTIVFGLQHGLPVTGDFNGDGITDVGVFDDGQWFLDANGDGRWNEGDLWCKLGHRDDKPVVGDWDGDGKDDIGIYGPAWPGDPHAVEREPGIPHPLNPNVGLKKNLPPEEEDATSGTRKLREVSQREARNDLIDHVFHFGTPTDAPIVGDWKGSGVSTIAIFRNGRWRLDTNGDGRWSDGDEVYEFGQEGDRPVVGDWDGDGITDLGVFRADRQSAFYLDTNKNRRLDPEDRVIHLGGPNSKPVAGDFNGDGTDEVGVYDPAGNEPVHSEPSAQ